MTTFAVIKMKIPIYSGLVLLCSALFFEVEANVLSCCKKGLELGVNAHEREISCAPNEVELKGLGGSNKDLCMGIYKSCCETRAKNVFCEHGQKMALAKQECVKSDKKHGKHMKTCCECCKMGSEQGKQGGSCLRTGFDQVSCNNVYKNCCNLAKLSAGGAKVDLCSNVNCDSETTLGCQKGKCKCKSGFVSTNNGRTCVDKDECKDGPCQADQICVNTKGSFRCESKATTCGVGYELKNGRCEDKNECENQQHRCGQYFCLNQPGKYTCLTKCSSPNYKLLPNKECIDVNECVVNPKICPAKFKCVNRRGSYRCVRVECGQGFKMVDGKCKDIDECMESPDICGNGGTCYNSLGRYHCKCRPGFVPDPKTKKCVDLDECTSGRAFCSYKCENTFGSYRCVCPEGFTIQGSYCKDQDECLNKPCGPDFHCFNTYGSYECIPMSCPASYYTQDSYRLCTKGACNDDPTCKADPISSVKWAAYKMYKTTRKNSFRFTYTLSGYDNSLDIYFYFQSGNKNKAFEMTRRSRNQVVIKNDQPLEGPITYNLRMHADVSQNGQLVERVVYILKVFVAAYNFG